jgi:hypothetical protein
MDIRGRSFLDRAESERQRTMEELAEPRQRLEVVSRELAAGDEQLAETRKRLDSFPGMPDRAGLTRRNAVEQHAHEALIRDRRQREHEAVRSRLQAEERQAAESVRRLRAEEARLAKLIQGRQQILDSRVRQLHQHTLRRCRTYQRYLIHKHPAGAAVIPLLNLGQPSLPDWLEHLSTDTTPVMDRPH